MNHIYPVDDLSTEPAQPAITGAGSISDAWPAFTTLTREDVIVAAVSLDRLVGWCGTPCVHAADAVEPGSSGRASTTTMSSVIVTRVIATEWRSDFRLHVEIDADLSHASCEMEQSRIIGRDAGTTLSSVVLEAYGPNGIGFAAQLPATIVVGDLIAIPSQGVPVLHDLRRSGLPIVR